MKKHKILLNSISIFVFFVYTLFYAHIFPSSANNIAPQEIDPPITVQESTAFETRSTGGPDNFGYSWDDSEPLSWVDTSGGTDTGLNGYSHNQATGPISLPFSFNFYGLNYTQIYIAASGYISFSNSSSWAWQQQIPSIEEPNNVIAPFWSPNIIEGESSWVRYASFGAEPDRYFVIEWHEVTYDEGAYTFEVILHEDGDILFQYGEMVYSGLGRSGGIEDMYGTDGLSIGEGYSYTPASNSAVRFIRPEASARIGLPERNFGSFTQASNTSEHEIAFINLGDLGSDTYNLTISSSWTGEFYDESGVLLPDTSEDGIPDTGSIPQGSAASVFVKIATPPSAIVGDKNEADVAFTSVNDPSVTSTVSITTAIPYPFAQSYALISEDNLYFDVFHPRTELVNLVGLQHNSRSTAIAETEEGFIYLFHSETSPDLGKYVSEIWFSLLDRTGTVIESEIKLTDHSGETIYHRDLDPTVVTAPNGKIGIAWSRTSYDSENDLYNSNVFLAILDEHGNIITPGINLTNNTLWESQTGDNLSYRQVVIDVTTDNRFVLAWANEGVVDSVLTAIVDSNGTIIQPMTNIEYVNQQAGHSILALDDGNVFLAYFIENPFGDDYFTYLIFDNNGTVVKEKFSQTISSARVQTDSVQVTDGTIILSWISYIDSSQIGFIVFSGVDYETTRGPDSFSNPIAHPGNGNISLTPTYDEKTILTWSDSTRDGYENSSHLYYAVMNSSGNLISEPMIFMTGNSIVPLSDGYSNTSFSGTPPVFTSSDNTAFTEGEEGSFEITASGIPYPVITYTNALPTGVDLVDNIDGTATLSGTPSIGTGGLYSLSLSADNGVLPNGSQEFVLKINTIADIDTTGGVIVNNNGNTQIDIPENAVDNVTEFIFEPLPAPTESIGNFSFFGTSFQLSATDAYGPVTNFNNPLTVTIDYDETTLGNVDEDSIFLYYWNDISGKWEDAACSEYSRNLDEDWFSVAICHLSEFAVLDKGSSNSYLPLIMR